MLDSLLQLTPVQFEQVIADLLEDLGFTEVERVGGSGDLGLDVRCTDPNGRSTVVQCKRYAPERVIGSPLIQHFYGMVVRARAEHGIFVTTSSFTAPALKLAEECDIELIDGAELTRRLRPGWASGAPSSDGSEEARDGEPPDVGPPLTVFTWHPEFNGLTFAGVYETLRIRFKGDSLRFRRMAEAAAGRQFTDEELRLIYPMSREWGVFEADWWSDHGNPASVAWHRLKLEIFREELRRPDFTPVDHKAGSSEWEALLEGTPELRRAQRRFWAFAGGHLERFKEDQSADGNAQEERIRSEYARVQEAERRRTSGDAFWETVLGFAILSGLIILVIFLASKL